MTLAPTIETPRLELRGHLPSDLPDSIRMWQSPETIRFIGGRPLTEEEVWLRLLRYWGGWAMLGYGFWRIVERATGRFVGEIGFHELHRDSQPSFAGEPEAGWALMAEFHGRGFAREALDAALAWGDANIEARRTVCIIHPANAASLKLARAVGYVDLGDLSYKGGTMVLLGRGRP